MIPASVIPSVNANASNAGALFPLMEPTSAQLAEFDQLLGEFGQQTLSQSAISSQLSTNTTDLLKVASLSIDDKGLTPEALLSNLAEGAGLALQPLLLQSAQTQDVNLQTLPERISQELAGIVPAQTPEQGSLQPLVEFPVNPVLPQSAQTQDVNLQTNPERISKELNDIVPVQKATSENQVQGLLSVVQSATDESVSDTSEAQASQAMINTTNATKPMMNDTLDAMSLLASPISTKTTSSVYPFIISATAVPSSVPSMNTSLPAQMISTLSADIATLQSQLIHAESELTQSGSILGENHTHLFSALSATTGMMTSSVMQTASMTTDASAFLSQSNATAFMATNLTAAANSAAQDQTKDQSTERHWTSFSEDAATDLSSESSSDEFFVTLASSLTQSATHSSILSSPLNMRQPQWTQDLSQRVQVMVNQSMDALEVRLDPLGLGPMKIGLKLDVQLKAHVTLSAQHGVTREMLENALPRLKELLAQEGIELASATVDSGEKQAGDKQNRAQSSHQFASDLSEDAANITVSATVTPSTEYLVDQFA